jgi:hemoglobin
MPRDPLPITTPPASATNDGAVEAGRDLCDEDLHGLLTTFYDRIEREPLLAPYFRDLDMREHIPRIADFWSTILFQTRRYSDNAFRPHLEMPGLTPAHFARWVATLEAVVDDGWRGPAAQRMKDMAHRIAYSMQVRLRLEPFEPYAP